MSLTVVRYDGALQTWKKKGCNVPGTNGRELLYHMNAMDHL